MQQKVLNILLTITLITILFISNEIIEISIFLLIIFATLNKNYYSYLSIIPLFFINSNAFFLFILFVSVLLFISTKIENKKLKNSIIILILALFYTYQVLINKTEIMYVSIILLTTLPAILLDTFKKGINQQYINELLVMSILILNAIYMPLYLFLTLYAIIIVCLSLLYSKPYYIITAFFLVSYTLFTTNNFVYLLIQIIAYLCYLFKNLLIKNKEVDGLEFIIEDINQNVSKFLSFVTNFSNTTYNSEYEKNNSNAIKILIENFCAKCRNKHFCFAEKKMETYINFKRILSSKETINFNCLNYQDLIKKASFLSKEYKLHEEKNITDYKLDGVCYSIQNYFLSLFEKASPKIMNILNFKKILIEKNIAYTTSTHSILSDEKYQLKFFSNKKYILEEIKLLAENYFDKTKISIQIKDDCVCIYPKKTFKVLYDFATLSCNNQQISGDNFLIKTITDSNFICALSDGMGSGYNAYKLSQHTLKMVDQITECSIDFETSLEILNNFFKTKDAQDSYATLDFVDINLSNGILNLYKMGSSTTYILRDNKVVPIYNNNLPFGISDLVIKEEYTLKENDLVILVSDGVTDYICEDALINYIEKLKNESPHKIVYEILQKIYYENNNQIKDDMSCVVMKLKLI